MQATSKASRRFLHRSFAAALLVAASLAPSTRAKAGWPLPEGATSADAANPANWPNDPSYGWAPGTSTTGVKNGQWELYSFMPQPNMARPEETATGMSDDLAWRYTIGDPRVIMAITDSGIEWEDADIIEAAYLNHHELKNHRPTHADGSPCGDLNPMYYPGDQPADIAGFDCNGDGILTVSDYKDSTNLSPPASPGHPLGDKNNNGVLDAGDLILNFSDGVDDDGNGYIDDISGWDFMKGDNDPYDDTRYGHGTGEARDSNARANNGIDKVGGCPNCRFMPLRCGDSFITDVTYFGEAAVYATDMHVKIIQSALGTINNNRFAQAGLDYAWENGLITIASMADENSRHHNMPTSSNHTLPVHAIEYSGPDITTARTFLQYHPCSNYGGQNFLSASGGSCSSEATGQLAGITGLVFSAGLKYGVDLKGAEVQQILMMNADDIDVPESRMPDAIDRWSQPGFDQRFGYGRVNANSAVEAVKAGKIPPIVDITSPTWFSVLYKDQVTAPIDIVGTVSASRATSYDMVAEWAPGVQPLDGAFVQFASQANVPASTVLGQNGPIAQLDIRNVDPAHDPDVDSPLGENKYTITVRVRAVAHYGGAVGDVKGELRRTYYVYQDADLLPGFPMYVGGGGESSPKMADIDGDGVRELLYPTAAGELHVIKMTPKGPVELWGKPFVTDPEDGLKPNPPPGVPSYLTAKGYQGGVDPNLGREAITTSAPAIGDIDGDGKPEIVFTTYAGTVHVVGSDGNEKPGWPKRLPDVPSCSLDPSTPTPQPCMGEQSHIARGAFAAPVLVDMTGSGHLDIIQAAFDGNVYVWDKDGNNVPGFPVAIGYKGPLDTTMQPTARVFTTPAVADFNGDGIPDILVGSNQKLGNGGGTGAVYLVDGRGTKAPSVYFKDWPVTLTSLNLFPLVAEGITNAPVIGSFSGQLLAVMHGNASPPFLLPLDPGPQTALGAPPANTFPVRPDPDDPTTMRRGLDLTSIYGPLSTAPQPDTMLPLFAQPAIGDLDQDGVPDVIASGGSLSLATSLQSATSSPGANLLAMWSGKTGAMMPASPMILEDFTFMNSMAVADISGDGYPEVIVGSGGYYLHAYDACGREPDGWPKFTGQWIIPTPVVGDITGDGKLDVAVGTRDGWLYAWRTGAGTDSVIEWESYHHDNMNTGNYNVPLDQGGKSKATKPLDMSTCMTPSTMMPNPTDTVAGGCSCRVGAEDDGEGALSALLGAAAIGGIVVRRRRTRAAA